MQAHRAIGRQNAAANEDILEFRARNCNTRETAKDSASSKIARRLGSSNHAPCLPPPAVGHMTTGCATSCARSTTRACSNTSEFRDRLLPAGSAEVLARSSPLRFSPWTMRNCKPRSSRSVGESDFSSLSSGSGPDAASTLLSPDRAFVLLAPTSTGTSTSRSSSCSTEPETTCTR